MRGGLQTTIMALLVLCAVAACAPPIGFIEGQPADGSDTFHTLWIVPLRTIYDLTPANNRFRPFLDISVFVNSDGMVKNIPVSQVEVELCEYPDAADLVFEQVPNPPSNAENGFYRFRTNGRYLARVVYEGAYSDPYSIQVGPTEKEPDPDPDESGIKIKWRPLVEFESNGGSPVPGQRLEPNGTATEPSPPPVKSGFTFGGWYMDKDLTNKYDFTSPVPEGITLTLYAKWI
jgi:uncharacterized repeat protein (TIGR02543 family)